MVFGLALFVSCETARVLPPGARFHRICALQGTSMKQPQSQTKRASQRDFQTVIMGTGDQHLENELRYLSRTLPGRGAGSVGFDERFAHRMLAAADILVVPSRFEPCGLVALAALRYGAVPVVASTGGLRDIVSGRFLLGTCPTLVRIQPTALGNRAVPFLTPAHASHAMQPQTASGPAPIAWMVLHCDIVADCLNVGHVYAG